MSSGERVFGIWYCRKCGRDTEFIAENLNMTDPDMAECCACGYQYGKIIDMSEKEPGRRVKRNLSQEVVRKGAQRWLDQQARLSKIHNGPVAGLVTPQMIVEWRRREDD